MKIFRTRILREIINQSTNPTMTRMEAFQASKAAGLDCSWETFKRVSRGKVWATKNK